jgi:hypothetical protein
MVGSLMQSLGRPPGFPLRNPTEQFSPRQIGGLEYWFDAQDLGTLYQDSGMTSMVTADGQLVGAWGDKAKGRNVTQPTGTLQPIYRSSFINSRPAVEADGVDDHLKVALPVLAQPLTIYFVGKVNTTAIQQRWLDGASGSLFQVIVASTGVRRMSAPTNIDAGAASTTPKLHVCVFNTTASEYYVDGVLAAGPTDVGANSITGLTLFATRSTFTNNLSGGLGEFLIYSGAHTASQRSQMEQYLKRRWGIA